MEYGIIVLIVVLAAGWLIKNWLKPSPSCSCGSGCQGCQHAAKAGSSETCGSEQPKKVS